MKWPIHSHGKKSITTPRVICSIHVCGEPTGSQPVMTATVLEVHAVRLGWRKDLVCIRVHKYRSLRKVVCSVSNLTRTEWGAVFERGVQFSLIHPCDVYYSQCNAQRKWRSCSHIASYPVSTKKECILGTLPAEAQSLALIHLIFEFIIDPVFTHI